MGSRLMVVGVAAWPFLHVYRISDWTLVDDSQTFQGPVLLGQVQRPEVNPDGSLLAYGVSVSPFLNVIDLATGNDVSITGGKPGHNVNALAFNPAGTRLAVGFSSTSSPYFYVYDTSDWSRISPETFAWGGTLGLAYSPDGSKLALASNSTPFLVVYNTSNWTQVTLTGGNPDGVAFQPHWSPDGSLLAVSHVNGNRVTVYNTSNWAKVTLTGGGLPGSGDYACRFNPAGTRLAVGHSTSPFLTVYNTSNWSKVTLTGGNPAAVVKSLSWSHDGAYLATAHTTTPFVTVYNTSDWSKVSGAPATLPAGNGIGILMTDAWQSVDLAATGTAVVRDASGTPAVRTVRAYDRSSGRFLAQKQSNSSGEFAMSLLTTSEKQLVYLDDDAGTLYNDLVNRVIPQ